MKFFLVSTILSLSLSPLFAQGDPNLASIPANDPAMAAAVAQARASLAGFVERSRHPGVGEEGFSVKVGLGSKGHREFFWLAPFKVENGSVSGELDNEPETIEGYRKSQTITMPLGEVSDWMYFDRGKMKGNYTACVLISREGDAALADYEKTYGANCKKPAG